MTYTHRPSPHKTAVNTVNADATANSNTVEPVNTSVKAVVQPKSPARKTAVSGSKLPPSNQPVWVPCSKHWKKLKQRDMDYRSDWGVTNGTLLVCKPSSPCDDSHWAVSQNHDWAIKGGKPKGASG